MDNGFEEPLYPESISLTNEYSSYVTTYEEYQVQLLWIKLLFLGCESNLFISCQEDDKYDITLHTSLLEIQSVAKCYFPYK